MEDPVNYIPAVPSESVRTAEKSYLDRPYSTHWEDELLLQASQAFSDQQEEEEDSLLLAASQDYEKRCGPLMTSDDVQSAVTAQVPLNIKSNNNWATNTWQAWAIGRNKSPHCHKSLRLINNLSTCGQVNMIFIDPTTSKETPMHSCVRDNTPQTTKQVSCTVMGQQSTTSQVINLWFIAYVYPCFNYKKLRKFSIITVSLLYITTTTSCNCSTTPTDSPTPLVVGGCHSNR